MVEHKEPSFVQQRSPSFSSATSLASSDLSTTPLRSTVRRSLSSATNVAPLPSLATVVTPAHTLGEASFFANPLPQSAAASPSLVRATPPSQTSQKRLSSVGSSTFSMSKLDQTAWPDASATNNGSPSSVWNGRPPSTMDGDAVTTAATSNVSTPGRGPSALDAKDVAANASVFTPSPLLPQDGSAWSVPRPGSLAWATDLATRPKPAELMSESTSSSPNAVKRVVSTDLSAGLNTLSPPSLPKADIATTADDSAAHTSPNSSKKPAAPVPKRVPIRSATLDPGHLASKRRLSGDMDDPIPSGRSAEAEDKTLVDEMNTLTISTNDVATSDAAAQQHDYHAHRPSGSFPPPPFSPGEALMHPSPYLPGSGARSPEGYAHGYPGVAHMLPGMAPIDMSGYESYRTTPDPYAPTMPGRAIFASPGSQGSTPQSPSFAPAPLGPHINASMRNGEALFYPGIVPGFAPPHMAGGMASPVRPVMPPGVPQFGFGPGPGVDARSSQLAQSPMMAPGLPMPMGSMVLPPTSPPMTSAQMSSSGPDNLSSPALSHSSPYAPGPHRRMGSVGTEPFGPGLGMSPRPPFAMTNQAGPFVPGPPSMHGMMGGTPMHGSMMAWNGRFHDHRRIPTGPGGVMAPVGGYGVGLTNGHMDAHLSRNGGGFYGGHVYPVGGNGSAGPSGSGGAVGHSRSPLLEEFRSRHAKNRKFELADIYGSVVEFSGDQHGSRFIQEKLDTASAEEKKTLFEEVLPRARQLMTDVFGNYVIQKMLEHGDEEQRDILAREMAGHVLPLSLGTYGCRVVQKAFDHISAPQREKLAKELDGHIMQCVRDQNANHVVQKVIERVDADKINFIPQAFVGHVPALASHCYSCRVLQRTFEHCTDTQTRPLLDELHAEAYTLIQHQYGNYVIQWVLQRGQPRDREQVIAKIKGSVLTLSRHKFASNVIEEVVRTCSRKDRTELLEEILTPVALASSTVPENNKTDASTNPIPKIAPAVLMMKDQFANYVLQRFLEKADKEERRRLIEVVQPSLISAKKAGPMGGGGHTTKHLVAIERLIETLQADDGAVGTGAPGTQPQPQPQTQTQSQSQPVPVASGAVAEI